MKSIRGVPTTHVPSSIEDDSLKLTVNGQKVTLALKDIKEIYYFDGVYYIVTDPPVSQATPVPHYASKLNFFVKPLTREVCAFCGSPIEYDADEGMCPRCGYEYETKRIQMNEISIDIDEKAELEQFVSKFFNVNAEYHDDYYWGSAGGNTPQFSLEPVDFKLYKSHIKKINVIENPIFIEHHWDEDETIRHEEKGRFIVTEVSSARSVNRYYLFTFMGEPDMSTLNKLIEAKKELAKRGGEKSAEEIKEELNESDVIKKIIANLPDWADGALIKTEVEAGEGDYDTTIQIYPVKKSKWNNDYYTSFEWKSILVNIPEQYLHKYLHKYSGKIILRDNQTKNAKLGKQKGKYVPVSLVSVY
jgi:hypothetical protein